MDRGKRGFSGNSESTVRKGNYTKFNLSKKRLEERRNIRTCDCNINEEKERTSSMTHKKLRRGITISMSKIGKQEEKAFKG